MQKIQVHIHEKGGVYLYRVGADGKVVERVTLDRIRAVGLRCVLVRAAAAHEIVCIHIFDPPLDIKPEDAIVLARMVAICQGNLAAEEEVIQ